MALIHTVGAGKLCSKFEATYFVRSSGLFRSKFGVTSYEVRGYFVRNSALLRTKFEATSYEVRGYFVRSSALLRTKFGVTSYEVRGYFVRSSRLLRTKFEATFPSNEIINNVQHRHTCALPGM